MIKIQINNICAKLVECEPLTAGMIGKTLDVEFSADWAGLSKTAVFSNGDKTIDVMESEWNGNTINIPWEVLETPNRAVSFGIYGYTKNGDDIILAIPTLYTSLGRVYLGVNPEGDESAEPSLPVYAQLDLRVTELEEHGGGIPDAPEDGKQYARQDGEWTEVQSASGDAKAIGRACYNLLAKAVYTEDVTALMSALWALVGANLVSISAVFTQGATIVYPATSLDALKPMLVVTATYDDSTTAEIDDYTLSGTLAEGTSTITATYQSKTATFTVNVSAEPIVPTLDYISAVYTQGGTVYPSTALDDLKADLVVTAHLTDESTQIVDDADYTLSGTLTVGTSVVTVSYEDKTITFNVTVSEIPVVIYSVTNNLTNCTNSNAAVSIAEGENYSATITADEGYALDSVVCLMNGVSQTVVDGVINIASVTGNIVITASAVIPTPTTQYALHNTGGTDARFYIGKKIDDFDTVQMTFEMPTFEGTKVLFNRLTATSGWSGIQNGEFLNMTSDKTVNEILGQGKVTANFVITQGYQGYEYYTGFVTSSFNPEYTLYEIKLLKNGEVTHDWKPTATVGEMFDSVTQTTRNFTSTNGLTVSEVNA